MNVVNAESINMDMIIMVLISGLFFNDRAIIVY